MDNKGAIINQARGTNIIDAKELQEHISKVLGIVSKSIRNSLGPFGGNTLISDPYSPTPVVGTKDGYRIMLDIQFENIIDVAIYQILRDVSFRMNTQVGDGTTSGNINLNVLYQGLKVLSSNIQDEEMDYAELTADELNTKHLKLAKPNKKITPFAIQSILEKVEEALIDKLKSDYIYNIGMFETQEERAELYRKVATIAANNNPKVGEIISSIYADRSVDDEVYIDIIRSPDEDTHIEPLHGFELGTGYIDQRMVNQSDGIRCEYKNPRIMIVSGPFTDNDLETLFNVIGWMKQNDSDEDGNDRGLVIFAQEFTQGVMNMLLQMRVGLNTEDGKLYQVPVVAIPMDSSSNGSKNRTKDFAVSVGAVELPSRKGKIISFSPSELQSTGRTLGDTIEQLLGSADVVKVTPNHTAVVGGHGDPKQVEERINLINEQIRTYSLRRDDDSTNEIAILKKRAGMLKSNMSAIYVGGRSYKEKESAYYQYEDAVFAVRSVLKNGATCGGNLSIVHAISTNLESLVEEITDKLITEQASILIGNAREDILEIVRYVLKIISNAFLSAYRWVLMEAVGDISKVHDALETYLGIKLDEFGIPQYPESNEGDVTPLSVLNLKNHVVEKHIPGRLKFDKNNNLVVAGNTDVELIKSVFTVCTTFLTANQFLTRIAFLKN